MTRVNPSARASDAGKVAEIAATSAAVKTAFRETRILNSMGSTERQRVIALPNR
jgi:hypothetical protein